MKGFPLLSYENHTRPDAMDIAAGLDVTNPTFALRAERPEFLEGAEQCRRAVLEPQDGLGLSSDLRNAIARRVALGAGNPRLLSQYSLPENSSYNDLAEGRMPADPKLAILAAHADMIAATPAAASRDHLERLRDAGFTTPQIIAVSELLAFACFQIRVAHGLSLLGEQQ